MEITSTILKLLFPKCTTGELYLANTDPRNLMVCRIAHHRSSGRRGRIGYFAEPHPVISPSGTRILFNSDWNNSGKVDAYVIELN